MVGGSGVHSEEFFEYGVPATPGPRGAGPLNVHL